LGKAIFGFVEFFVFVEAKVAVVVGLEKAEGDDFLLLFVGEN